jgi:hypothetical protein
MAMPMGLCTSSRKATQNRLSTPWYMLCSSKFQQ